MNKVIDKSYELKALLESDKRIILLNKLEKEMDDSNEVIKLTYIKDIASNEYSDCLNHFGEDSNETKLALKKLYEAKKNLDSHPLVKEYLKAYQDVRILYKDINEILFSLININLCEVK